nr:hypothetical protein [Tanacetum cinerariifolium]
MSATMQSHLLTLKEKNGAPLIKDWEPDEEDEVESPPEKQKKPVEPSVDKGHSHKQIEDQGYFDSGCSWHMKKIFYLTDFKEFDEGYVAFGGGAKGGKITGKETIRTGYVAFGGGAKGGKITGKETIRTADESHVLLKVPRKNNMYSVDIKNIVPKKDLTCFVAKVTNDESMLWHRRLGHINFKSINKLVKIEEEVYMCQPLGFEDPDYPDKVYKVEKALYGLHQALRACEFKVLMHDKFQMSSMGELTFYLGLQVKQKPDVIFISQDKYVDEILRKFKYENVKPYSAPMDKEKALLKDSDGDDVDTYLYRYLKGYPKLSLWYPRDFLFDLVAYTNSDYVGASLDRKSTLGGCQFLWCKLISWQCKKQTVVAISTTKAEYVAAASCCGQVL